VRRAQRLTVGASFCLLGLFLVAAVLCVASHPVAAYASSASSLQAQEAPSPDPQTQDPTKQVSQYLEWLREEMRAYRESLAGEREYFVRLVEFAVAIATCLLVLAGVWFALVVGRTKREIRETMEERLQQFEAKAHRQVEEAATAVVRHDADAVRVMIERELGFRGSKVLILSSEAPWPPELAHAGKELEGLGLAVTMATIDQVTIASLIPTASLVVYRLRHVSATAPDPGLRAIVTLLCGLEPQRVIPLVVYYPGRVDGVNESTIQEYVWTTYANSASRLISETFTSLLAFGGKRQQAGSKT
jgi:hypothetical protein